MRNWNDRLGPENRSAGRPIIRGHRGMVSAGHYLAALAGYEVLLQGGNAVDAGVAAGLVINVVHQDMTTFGGVAPVILYSASEGRVVTISGVGRWPKSASLEYFMDSHEGKYPRGVLRSVVPAAPDAWLTALSNYGTMSFGEVAGAALRYAEEGYSIYEFQHENLRNSMEDYLSLPESAKVFFPEGRLSGVGEILVQPDLARTFKRLIEAEASRPDRQKGLKAARDYFYKGPIAREIDAFSRERGGFLRASDLADFSVKVEEPVSVTYRGHQVFTCGPWCQGPVLAQALRLLEDYDLKAMGHNSPEYLHTLLEALKLAFSDREAYYGDPEFVNVPMDDLLSEAYISERRRQIDPREACPEMPSPGVTLSQKPVISDISHLRQDDNPAGDQDTSYLAVMDGEGNVFSATPSDGCCSTPIIPGLGFPISPRGTQSRLDPVHPSRLEPWKRPRLTPSPALIMKDGEPFMAIGTPGADVQPQAMLQVICNIIDFGMNPQQAVEEPRIATYSYPASFYPHHYFPGRVAVEGRLPREVVQEMANRGHRIKDWPAFAWEAGAVCVVMRDPVTGVLSGAADPRRESYAAGY